MLTSSNTAALLTFSRAMSHTFRMPRAKALRAGSSIRSGLWTYRQVNTVCAREWPSSHVIYVCVTHKNTHKHEHWIFHSGAELIFNGLQWLKCCPELIEVVILLWQPYGGGLLIIKIIDCYIIQKNTLPTVYVNMYASQHLLAEKGDSLVGRVKLTKQQKHVSMIPMSSGRLRSFTLMAPS